MNAYLLKFQHKNASTGEKLPETSLLWISPQPCFWIPNPSNSGLFSTEDLWDCLEQASGKPIAAVMSSWTKQMGFPIIVVEQEQVSFTALKSATRRTFFVCFFLESSAFKLLKPPFWQNPLLGGCFVDKCVP